MPEEKQTAAEKKADAAEKKAQAEETPDAKRGRIAAEMESKHAAIEAHKAAGEKLHAELDALIQQHNAA